MKSSYACLVNLCDWEQKFWIIPRLAFLIWENICFETEMNYLNNHIIVAILTAAYNAKEISRVSSTKQCVILCSEFSLTNFLFENDHLTWRKTYNELNRKYTSVMTLPDRLVCVNAVKTLFIQSQKLWKVTLVAEKHRINVQRDSTRSLLRESNYYYFENSPNEPDKVTNVLSKHFRDYGHVTFFYGSSCWYIIC